MFPDFFLIHLKYSGLIKWRNTGFQDQKHQEMMKNQNFDVQYDEIGILLGQSEAEKINKAIKPII